MRIHFLLILLFLSSSIGYCQTAALDKYCMDYLGERANSLKVKTYSVRIDEMEGGVIVLKENKGSVKGVLFFPKEKKALRLSGSDQTLYLRDNKGFDHGKISYTIDNEKFTGTILSNLEKKMSTISGAYTRDVPVIPPACYVDKWMTYQKGTVGEESIHLYLQRIGNGDLQGLLFFTNHKIAAFVSGIIVDDNVDLMVLSNIGKKMGQIRGHFKKGQLNAIYTDKLGASKKVESKTILRDNQSCYADISQDSRYSIIYPKLGIPAFDDKMNQWANDWIQDYKKDKTNKNTIKHTRFLNAPSAYSYLDLHCRDQRYFSGYLMGYLPKNNKYTVQSVNFDLRKKVFLQLEDLFDAPVQVKAMVKVAALKSMTTHPLKDNVAFKKWLRKENFDNFVIQPDGILFSSNFHSIFGQQHVLFSYTSLKPYLKNKKIYKYFRKLK